MLISTVIVEYKKPEFTKLCIKSLQNTTYKNKEIIVIDNSFNNIGLAAAQNKGAKQSKGDYLFFLNNDTIVKRDIFEHLLKSPFDVTGCRMFDYSGKRELDSAISLDRFGCPAGKTGPMFYPDGAIFIKRKVFEEVGGFDEKLFLFGEDRDLCWRVLAAAYTVGYCPTATFYHASHSVVNTKMAKERPYKRENKSLDNVFFVRRGLSERNIIRTMLKNYTAKSLIKILPQYLFWSMLELGVILLTKPKAIIKSYLPAYWWNIKNLKDTINERKKVIRRIPDKDLPFSKVIGKLYVLRTMGVPI